MAIVDIVFGDGHTLAVEHSTPSDLVRLLSDPSDSHFNGRYLYVKRAEGSDHAWVNPDAVAYVRPRSD